MMESTLSVTFPNVRTLSLFQLLLLPLLLLFLYFPKTELSFFELQYILSSKTASTEGGAGMVSCVGLHY